MRGTSGIGVCEKGVYWFNLRSVILGRCLVNVSGDRVESRLN